MIYLPDNAVCPYCGEDKNLDYLDYVNDPDGNYYRIICHSCNTDFAMYDECDCDDEEEDN